MKALPKRRSRSHLRRRDCMRVIAAFARKVDRWAETSHGGTFGQFAPEGQIGVHLLVEGSFGAAGDFFEAMRVLAGYRIPSDAPTHHVKRPAPPQSLEPK